MELIYINMLGQYLYNWGHLLDQAANTSIGGDPRMTLSARMGRDIKAGRCRVCSFVCGVLDLFQKDHCAKAWRSDETPINSDMQVTKE